MRALFYRLNKSGIQVDISTFSKANKVREDGLLRRIYAQLIQKVKSKHSNSELMLFPIDSTVITLTSKLFHAQNYHQVKLLNGFNLTQNVTSECVINFGQEHDAKFTEQILTMIPDNAVAITDRGFASWTFVEEMSQLKHRFIIRIKNNMKTELDHDRYRVIRFYDIDSGVEFRLATNITDFSDEEISELYRHRWGIENLWKFLKMHLSLEQLITKNVNGVTTQIYMILIAYLILALIELPIFYGRTMLDKLRYLQLELSRRGSVVHWSFDWQPEILVS
jgi:putative transposase